jgi:hypothetical protein
MITAVAATGPPAVSSAQQPPAPGAVVPARRFVPVPDWAGWGAGRRRRDHHHEQWWYPPGALHAGLDDARHNLPGHGPGRLYHQRWETPRRQRAISNYTVLLAAATNDPPPGTDAARRCATGTPAAAAPGRLPTRATASPARPPARTAGVAEPQRRRRRPPGKEETDASRMRGSCLDTSSSSIIGRSSANRC